MKNQITYGIHATDFGDAVIGITDAGLCWLGFMIEKEQGAYKGDGLFRMKEFFPGADFVRDENQTELMLRRALKAWQEDRLTDIPLDLRGTDFQKAVWQALLTISRGNVCSYGDIAQQIGKAKAARAVGSAVGNNPVSLIVPCHRVVQSSGKLGNYGWGCDLKRKLLQAEQALDQAA